MTTRKQALILGGISLFVLAHFQPAEARKHRSDGKKPAEASQPADPMADTPGDKPADKPGDKPGDKPADKPGDKPAAKPAEAPSPATKPAAASATKPGPAAPAAAKPAPAAAAAVTAAPGPAAAPKELAPEVSGARQEAARAHFERGVELYTAGDYPNAWLEFNSAYQIVPLVDLLNNVARCEVRMGRPRDALEHFRRFIAARPNDQDSEYIRQEIARLEGEAGRTVSAEPVAEPVAPPPPPPRKIPVYSLIFGATTVAMLIAGAATLGIVNSRFNDLDSRCTSALPCNLNDVDSLHRQSYAGYGLLGAAGATAALTGIFLVIELRSPKEQALRPLAGLSVGTPMAALGRF